MRGQYIGVILALALIGFVGSGVIGKSSPIPKTRWLESPVTVKYYAVTNSAGEVNWGVVNEDWIHNNVTISNIQIGLREDGNVIWRKKPLEISE